MTIIQLDGIRIGFETIKAYQSNYSVCDNILKLFDTFPFYSKSINQNYPFIHLNHPYNFFFFSNKENSCFAFIENDGIKNLIEIIRRKQMSHGIIGHACVTLSLFATNNFYIPVDSIKDCIETILYAIKQVANTDSCKVVANALSEVVIYSNSKYQPFTFHSLTFLLLLEKGQVTSILENQLNLIISILRKRIDCPDTCTSLCAVLNSFALERNDKIITNIIHS